jgi:hypothetical protein
MTPCIGCIKRKKMNMGITGNFRMKFIGKPEGKLMKNAPGNFEHGKEYVVPYGHSKFPFWEMLEPEPKLVVPEDTDSFEEAYFVPDDSATVEVEEWSYTVSEPPVEEVTMSEPEEETVPESTPVEGIGMTTHTPHIVDNVDYALEAPAIIEPYGTFRRKTGGIVEHKEDLIKKNRGEAILDLEVKVDNMSRGVLLGILKDAGVPVKKRTRTTTLRKMVDDLDEN